MAAGTRQTNTMDEILRKQLAFCNGNDAIAERFDGPDGYIAFHANARSELDALVDIAYGVTT